MSKEFCFVFLKKRSSNCRPASENDSSSVTKKKELMKQLHKCTQILVPLKISHQHLLFLYVYLLGISLRCCSSISQWSNISIFSCWCFFFKTSLNFHFSSLQVRVRYTGIHLAIGSRHFESPRPISDKRNVCLRFACRCVVPWDTHDSARPPSDRESVHSALQRSGRETNQVWLLRGSLSESVCFAHVSWKAKQAKWQRGYYLLLSCWKRKSMKRWQPRFEKNCEYKKKDFAPIQHTRIQTSQCGTNIVHQDHILFVCLFLFSSELFSNPLP